MPLTAADLLQPMGELSPTDFPVDYVTAWLSEAVSKTSNEDAQKAWAYHRAYSFFADGMHAGAASERVGGISASISDKQFDYWSTQARNRLDEFQRLMGGGGSVVFAPIRFSGGR